MPTISTDNIAILAIIVPLMAALIGYFWSIYNNRKRIMATLFKELQCNCSILISCVPKEDLNSGESELRPVIIPIARAFIGASSQLSFDMYDAAREKVEVLNPTDVGNILATYNRSRRRLKNNGSRGKASGAKCHPYRDQCRVCRGCSTTVCYVISH